MSRSPKLRYRSIGDGHPTFNVVINNFRSRKNFRMYTRHADRHTCRAHVYRIFWESVCFGSCGNTRSHFHLHSTYGLSTTRIPRWRNFEFALFNSTVNRIILCRPIMLSVCECIICVLIGRYKSDIKKIGSSIATVYIGIENSHGILEPYPKVLENVVHSSRE